MTIKKTIPSLFVFIFIAQIAQLSAFTGITGRVINHAGKQLLSKIPKRSCSTKNTGEKNLLSITELRYRDQADLYKMLLEKEGEKNNLIGEINKLTHENHSLKNHSLKNHLNKIKESNKRTLYGAASILFACIAYTCQLPKFIGEKWHALANTTNDPQPPMHKNSNNYDNRDQGQNEPIQSDDNDKSNRDNGSGPSDN